MKIGYARTSTIDQVAGFEAQLRELLAAGCDKTYQEQVSSIGDRLQLNLAIEYAREGDCLVVTKLDRLVRSVADLMAVAGKLEKKGVSLHILNLNLDSATATGKMLLTMLGAIAQFEREIMLERQKEGIAKAKREGKFKGRKPIADEVIQEVYKLADLRISRKELAKRVNIGVASVYRILKERK